MSLIVAPFLSTFIDLKHYFSKEFEALTLPGASLAYLSNFLLRGTECCRLCYWATFTSSVADFVDWVDLKLTLKIVDGKVGCKLVSMAMAGMTMLEFSCSAPMLSS